MIEIETEAEEIWAKGPDPSISVLTSILAAERLALNLDLNLDLSHYCLHSHFTRLQQFNNRKSLDATPLNRYIAKPLNSQDK